MSMFVEALCNYIYGDKNRLMNIIIYNSFLNEVIKDIVYKKTINYFRTYQKKIYLINFFMN